VREALKAVEDERLPTAPPPAESEEGVGKGAERVGVLGLLGKREVVNVSVVEEEREVERDWEGEAERVIAAGVGVTVAGSLAV